MHLIDFDPPFQVVAAQSGDTAKGNLNQRERLEQRACIDQKLEKALAVSLEITGLQKGFIALSNSDGVLYSQKMSGFSGFRNTTIRPSGIIWNTLEKGCTVCAANQEIRTYPDGDQAEIREVCIPLKRDACVIGCIYHYNGGIARNISSDDWKLLSVLAAQVSSLLQSVRRTDANHQSDDEPLKRRLYEEEGIIIESERTLQVYRDIQRIAPIDIPVLVHGESGTGKELVARTLHRFSGRKGELVALNCAAIPAGIFESELFGSEKGAFNDAREKPGKLELADNGTLFLDEIGEMSSDVQPKLLRFIENGELTRLGGVKTRKLDVRIVAATNRNLEEMMAEKTFRADLFQRLACFKLNIPPLRERIEDIPALGRFFLKRFADQHGWPVPILTDDAVGMLQSYDWPGNIRELKNEVVKALVRNYEKQTISPEDFEELHKKVAVRKPVPITFPSLAEMEKTYILTILLSTRFNISKAAKKLGVSRSTLYMKLKKYEIPRQMYSS